MGKRSGTLRSSVASSGASSVAKVGKLQRYAKQVGSFAGPLKAGYTVVVDPSTGATSALAYAVYLRGVLTTQGELTPPRGNLVTRLMWLSEQLKAAVPDPVICLVVERLRGSMVHPSLHWAVGMVVLTLKPKVILEIPIPVWKLEAKSSPGYVKGDLADCLAMGRATFKLLGVDSERKVKVAKTRKKQT